MPLKHTNQRHYSLSISCILQIIEQQHLNGYAAFTATTASQSLFSRTLFPEKIYHDDDWGTRLIYFSDRSNKADVDEVSIKLLGTQPCSFWLYRHIQYF